MTGRGRGRGALARWEAANKTSGGEGTSRVGSSVFPLPKENWENEVKKTRGDSIRNDTLVRVTHIIDVEHFWAQAGKVLNNELYISGKNLFYTNRKLLIASPSNLP